IPGFQKQPDVDLVAVANRTKESGERVAKEFGVTRVYADWRDLVRARDVDAVCVGTWPDMHCEITLAALEHGKHVLCEARMAMDAAEGRRMLAAARRAPHLVAQLVAAPRRDRRLARRARAGSRRRPGPAPVRRRRPPSLQRGHGPGASERGVDLRKRGHAPARG